MKIPLPLYVFWALFFFAGWGIGDIIAKVVR